LLAQQLLLPMLLLSPPLLWLLLRAALRTALDSNMLGP